MPEQLTLTFKEVLMDLSISSFNFNDTEVTITAISNKGKEFFAKMYGAGACSVNLKRSFVGDFILFAKRKGLIVS